MEKTPLPQLPRPGRGRLGKMPLLWRRGALSSVMGKTPIGIPGLDHLLYGGLIRGNSLLIEGPPGSGKSTLAVRILYEGIAQHKEPGLLITFEEFPKQVYEEALAYGIDLRLMEDAGKLRVIWTSPARILEGFIGKNDLVEKIVNELGVRRLVIDSVSHFKRVATSEIELREILLKILNNLKLKGINTFLVKELERLDNASIAFEEYLVDASMRVYNSSSSGAGENLRLLEVRKTRGQPHISGLHPFRLGGKGLTVFPHLRPDDLPNLIPQVNKESTRRVPTGVPGLDAMLAGGLLSGSLNLVMGYSGTGKSVIGYHFLDAGLKAREPVLLRTIQSTPEEVLSQAESLGMFWRSDYQAGLLRILHVHPTGLCPEEMFEEFLSCIRELKPERFVFDSISDLWNASKDKDSVRDYIVLLKSLFEITNITAIITNQARQMGGDAGGDPNDFTDLAGAIIQLSMAESDGELRRFVGIRKHRGSEHAKELREFLIDSFGFRVERKAVGLSGILTGQTQGSLRQVSEEVLPSLDDVSESLRALTDASETPESVRKKLREARSNLGLIDVLLREHFGVTEFHKLAEEMESAKKGD